MTRLRRKEFLGANELTVIGALVRPQRWHVPFFISSADKTPPPAAPPRRPAGTPGPALDPTVRTLATHPGFAPQAPVAPVTATPGQEL